MDVIYNLTKLKPLSNRSRISTNCLPESFRQNSVILIRTVSIVRENSEGYGTSTGTGGFEAFSDMLENFAKPAESFHSA